MSRGNHRLSISDWSKPMDNLRSSVGARSCYSVRFAVRMESLVTNAELIRSGICDWEPEGDFSDAGIPTTLSLKICAGISERRFSDLLGL
jgi:hypothetical protein